MLLLGSNERAGYSDEDEQMDVRALEKRSGEDNVVLRDVLRVRLLVLSHECHDEIELRDVLDAVESARPTWIMEFLVRKSSIEHGSDSMSASSSTSSSILISAWSSSSSSSMGIAALGHVPNTMGISIVHGC